MEVCGWDHSGGVCEGNVEVGGANVDVCGWALVEVCTWNHRGGVWVWYSGFVCGGHSGGCGWGHSGGVWVGP